MKGLSLYLEKWDNMRKVALTDSSPVGSALFFSGTRCLRDEPASFFPISVPVPNLRVLPAIVHGGGHGMFRYEVV